MSGINISKKYHSGITTVTTAWAGTTVAYTSCSEINCSGYTKILVQYYCSAGWNRKGTIIAYGSVLSGGTYSVADAIVENGTFTVDITDDAGEYYVIESIAPFMKFGWTIETAGDTGTLTVLVMPFNE